MEMVWALHRCKGLLVASLTIFSMQPFDSLAGDFRCFLASDRPSVVAESRVHGFPQNTLFRKKHLAMLGQRLTLLRERVRNEPRPRLVRRAKKLNALMRSITRCVNLSRKRAQASTCTLFSDLAPTVEVLHGLENSIQSKSTAPCSLLPALKFLNPPTMGTLEQTGPDRLTYRSSSDAPPTGIDIVKFQFCVRTSARLLHCTTPSQVNFSLCSIETPPTNSEEIQAFPGERVSLHAPSSRGCSQAPYFQLHRPPVLGSFVIEPQVGTASYWAGPLAGDDSFAYQVCHGPSGLCLPQMNVTVSISEQEGDQNAEPPHCPIVYGNEYPSPRLCDIRLVQQSTYSSLDLTAFGMTNSGWSIGGSHFVAGANLSLSEMLEVPRSQVRESLQRYRAEHPELRVDELIVLDIEGPLGADKIGSYANNPSLQGQAIEALKMRAEVAREVFPLAHLGLWNTIKAPARGNVDNDEFLEMMAGLTLAARRGVLDPLDYLLPNIYIRYGPEDGPVAFNSFEAMTRAGVEATATLKRSDGSTLGIVPFMSMHVINGAGGQVEPWVSQRQVEILQEYSEVSFAAYWMGSDSYRGIDIPAFLREARVVPTACLCGE